MRPITTYIKKPRFNRGTFIEGAKLEIYHDDNPIDPREWDNIGHMICFHRRYNLGDEHDLHESDFDSWEEIEETLRNEYNAVVILPLYLYDHSGITMSVGPFACGWDSGQVGYIYASKEDIEKAYGEYNTETHVLAERTLYAEVEEYDDYLTGNVYGYIAYTWDGDDWIETDSCWGYFRDYKYIVDEVGFNDAEEV